MRKLLIAVPFLILANISAFAQFNSGSTSADGALDLSSCAASTCYVQLPESGILNYTTVNIPVDKTLRFRKNLLNTPAIILATGNVNIAGAILAEGDPTNPPFHNREPGPGGFPGGLGQQSGLGPGGGAPGQNGQWIGNVSLVPITGGSGGGGHAGFSNTPGGGGGGGLVIASSSSISISGVVYARGQRGPCGFDCGPSGSGGAIRLIANSITGAGELNATNLLSANDGVVRLEAQLGQVTFTGTSDPIAVVAPINPVIIQPNQATLKITTVGGFAVSPYAMGRPDRIDVLLPTTIPDPISIGVEGANIPSGTEVQFAVSGAGTATTCTLTGGPGPMNCTGSINGLSRTGISTIMAYVIYPPPTSLAKFNPKGENHVAKVRLESRLGAGSRFVFLNKKGREIAAKNLNSKFLKGFGM